MGSSQLHPSSPCDSESHLPHGYRVVGGPVPPPWSRRPFPVTPRVSNPLPLWTPLAYPTPQKDLWAQTRTAYHTITMSTACGKRKAVKLNDKLKKLDWNVEDTKLVGKCVDMSAEGADVQNHWGNASEDVQFQIEEEKDGDDEYESDAQELLGMELLTAINC